jgi:hypothetical protein
MRVDLVFISWHLRAMSAGATRVVRTIRLAGVGSLSWAVKCRSGHKRSVLFCRRGATLDEENAQTVVRPKCERIEPTISKPQTGVQPMRMGEFLTVQEHEATMKCSFRHTSKWHVTLRL